MIPGAVGAAGGVPFPFRPWTWTLTWCALALAHLAAIWASPYPPLVDYPNHLARAYVWSRYAATPEFQVAFVLEPRPTPYLGADVPLVLLLAWLPPVDAGRLVLSGTLLLFLAGCAWLGHALHGRWSFSSLSAVYCALGPALLFGFLSYLVGLGMFLCTAALFRPRDQGAPTWPRLALLALAATLCYFSHLSAFVLLVLFVGVLACQRVLAGAPARDAARLLVPLLPGLALHLRLLVRDPPESGLRWGTLAGKVTGLEWLGGTGSPGLDLTVAGLLAAVVLAAARRHELGASRPGLVLSGVLALLYAVFPEWLYGWAMDRRFLVPAGVLLLLSLEPRLQGRARWLALAVVLGLLARPLALGASFARASKVIGEQVELLRALPRHARVFPLVSESATGVPYYDRVGLRHIGHYATLEREAILPTLFVGGSAYLSTWVPLRWRTVPPVGEVPPQQVLVQDVPWNLVFLNDYVYAYGVRASYDRLLRSRCRVLEGRGQGVLFGPCTVRGTLAAPPLAGPPAVAAPGMLSREGRSGPER